MVLLANHESVSAAYVTHLRRMERVAYHAASVFSFFLSSRVVRAANISYYEQTLSKNSAKRQDDRQDADHGGTPCFSLVQSFSAVLAQTTKEPAQRAYPCVATCTCFE